jgi:hypothetical protein
MRAPWRHLVAGLLGVSALGASSARAQLSDDPWTVARGRTQIEADVYYSIEREAGTRTDSLNVAPLLLSFGLTERSELRLGFDGYYRDRSTTAGDVAMADDWGDLTVGAKYNLWGYTDTEWLPGDTALALLPSLKIPLKLGDGGSELVECGLLVPFAVGLPAKWTLVLMTGCDLVADSADDDHALQWVGSATVNRPLSANASGYLEFYSIHPQETGLDWSAQVNIGCYYTFAPDFCIDAGCNFGVTRSAPDLQPFVGLTYLY